MLFADEPTGALNSAMTVEVMDTLTDVHREGTTLVMVTHDPSRAARADRAVYLRDGTVAGSRRLGPWSPEEAQRREDDLLAWLRELGFQGRGVGGRVVLDGCPRGAAAGPGRSGLPGRSGPR